MQGRNKGGRKRLLLGASAMVLGVLAADRAAAEPVDNRYLAEAQLEARGACSILTIRFNFRTRYLSHFPTRLGKTMRINITPLDQGPDVKEALFHFDRESLRPVKDRNVTVTSIEFESDTAGGQVLSLGFSDILHYAVAQGGDITSLRIALSAAQSAESCLTTAPTASGRVAAPLSAEKKKRLGADLREAQKAMTAKDYDRAIGLLSRILQIPENEHSPAAQELLGLAREQKGQKAQAQAEYEEYLRRYPSGEGVGRVRQRLAGLVTATAEPRDKLRKAKDETRLGEMTASVSGSLSSYYFRNDRYFGSTEPMAFRFGDYEKGQSEFLHSADVIGEWGNRDFRSKLRFSGSAINDLLPGEKNEQRLSALYFDTNIQPWGLKGRVGRQSHNADGVLGRFDGGVLGWQATSMVSLNAVAGAPVASTRDLSVDSDRLFYGASVGINSPASPLNGSLYYIEQTGLDHSLERRAVGSEARYIDGNKSAFASLEYDVAFGEVNTALVTGSYTLDDKSVLSLSADYRRAFVLSSLDQYTGDLNAFQKLVRTLQGDDGFVYYFDRTAVATSASLGYSRSLGERFQINLNATATNFEPGQYANADGSQPTGNEYFYSTQLIGNGLVADGDIYTIGLRYSDTLTYGSYILDLNARYPLAPDLRLSPKLRLRYREWDDKDAVEYGVLPSLGLEYTYLRDHHFEVEAGSEWLNRKEAGVWDSSLDVFLVAGYRLDF
jgi:tetratricopeptide (TPR) repeat protein